MRTHPLLRIERHTVMITPVSPLRTSRVARWYQIWQILPKILVFQKNCQLFLAIFFMPNLRHFLRY